MDNNPIGIFDSGIGGLSVFSKLVELLPNENYIYFGDTKNLPYGNKTKEQLISFVSDIFDFFEEKQVKAVVMACNTTSATVYDVLKDKYNFKLYPIVQSASKYAANKNYSKIGVFATGATVNSHAYQRGINYYNPKIQVFEKACPTWAYIVENELQNESENIKNIEKIVKEMMVNEPDKIILGCTHYPYLTDILSRFAPKEIFLNPAECFAQYIANDIKQSLIENNKRDYEPKFYVSSEPEQFKKASKLFYNVENAVEINISKTYIK